MSFEFRLDGDIIVLGKTTSHAIAIGHLRAIVQAHRKVFFSFEALQL
jgi:hypothetical protein